MMRVLSLIVVVVVCLCQVPCPRRQHCRTKVGAYNTVRALSGQKGPKAPVLSYPDSTFLQAYRAWPSVLRLLECPVVPCAHLYEGPGCSRRTRQSLPSGVKRGGACPRPSGEAEPALRRRARRSLPSAIGRGGACPQPSGEAELALGRRSRRS